MSTHLQDVMNLEKTIGHAFERPKLLEQALTHSSRAKEAEAVNPAGGGRAADNEQLEFLGDAVLGLVTTEELFRRFPQFSEGQLSKLRAHLVSKNHLIRIAEQLDLGRYLRLGRGEEKSGGRGKAALLVDALEALLGAVYLDAGLETARPLILRHISPLKLNCSQQWMENRNSWGVRKAQPKKMPNRMQPAKCWSIWPCRSQLAMEDVGESVCRSSSPTLWLA